jgi:hypothetical protein
MGKGGTGIGNREALRALIGVLVIGYWEALRAGMEIRCVNRHWALALRAGEW